MYSQTEKKLKKKYKIPSGKAVVITEFKDEEELVIKQSLVKQFTSPSGLHKSSHIKQSELTGSNFLSADFSESKFDRVFIENSRLSGMSLAGSILVDVLFKGCKINRVSFGGAELKRVMFKECDLTDTDFQSAVLDKVVFRSCKLNEADYSNAIFKNVDIRGSHLKNTKFEHEQFEGLTIDQSQATYIALLSGVTID
jgi:uncharacterized protein YjbI with pentapeptide repeats